MSSLNNKIEFPRSSPDKLIEAGEKLVAQHDSDPKAVTIPPEKIEFIRRNVATAKQKREEAKAAIELSKKLNAESERILGLALGQTVEDETHVAGAISDFSKRAQLDFKTDLTQLRNYGFTVTQTVKAPRLSKAKIEKIQQMPKPPEKTKA
jgi:hypothetical protein